ncbi:MAG: glycosyltransferase family 4 protein [Vicinamibacterales bacterium]
MRILYLADIRFPLERANGIQSMETCHALARRAHAVHMVVRPDTEQPARDPYLFYGVPRLDSLTIERAPVSGPAPAKRLGYLAFALGRAIGRDRPDVVLTRDLGVAAFLVGLPDLVRPPVVYESHGYAPEVAAALPSMVATAAVASARKLRRLAKREAAVWQRAEGMVTLTQTLADDMEQRFGQRPRVAVVPDGVRLTPPDPRPVSQGRPIVAYAGHLYAWKGVDILLEALASMPDVEGLIVGGHEREPDLARTKAVAERLGVASRVTFTGLIEPPKVREQLARATVLILPNPASAISSRFTSPLKLFEYMAAGRPIVASDLPALREVLSPDDTAVLVMPGDAPALRAGIRRVLDDPGFAGRLASRALETVADFSWDRRAERLEALLHDVLGR